MKGYPRPWLAFTLVLSSLVASNAAHAYSTPLHFGNNSNEDFDRVGQILLRCGGRPVAEKSDFIENVVKSAQYFLGDETYDICNGTFVCSNGATTWFDEDRYKALPFRERVLKIIYERLEQRPVSATSLLATQLIDAIRVALPIISDQYLGKRTAPKDEELAAIGNIPDLLKLIGLTDSEPDEIRETCVKHFQGPATDGYVAANDVQMLFKNKEKIFDQRARESIKKAGDHLTGTTGDTVLWTGIYIVSQAHRYRVTGDEEAIANIEPSLWAFHHLHKVTGNKTLVARRMSLEPDRTKVLPKEHFRGAAGYEDYVWRGHVSWDMYLGYLYAIGESWDVIQDPKLKDVIREDIREIALGFIENGMAIDGYDTYLSSDPYGCFTDHRKCSIFEKIAHHIFGYFSAKAGNAIRALNLLQVAGHVTEDPRILKAYQELIDKKQWKYSRDFGLKRTERIIERWAIPILSPFIKLFKGSDVQMTVETVRDPVGTNLGHLSSYLLVRFEKDPKIRQYYLEGFEFQTHQPQQFDDNTFFDFLLGIYTRPDRAEVRDWLETFKHFPLDDHTHRTNSTNPDIEKYKGFDSKGNWNWHTYEPLALDVRPMHGFAWQVNVYKLDGGFEDACPGVPFLAAYWLGRYAGFITPED